MPERQSPHPKRANVTNLTIAEAARVRGQFVYGLCDRDGLFYVGKTRNAARRFETYSKQVLTHANPHLLRRLRDAGDDLRVVILSLNPANLNVAEADAISLHGDRLVNIVANPYRTRPGQWGGKSLGVTALPDHHRLAPCPLCDGPMDGKGKPYCMPCFTRVVRNRGQDKARARALSASVRSAP